MLKKSTCFDNYLLGVLLFGLVNLYANFYFFTGVKELSQFIPPFKSDHNRLEQTALGAEYLNIAIAIVQGRGFSDPFKDKTGPTGWSPPLMVFFLSLGLIVTNHDIQLTATLFLVFQNLVFAMIFTIVVTICKKFSLTTCVGYLAMAAVIIVNFRWLFQTTHDGVFQAFWINLIVLGLWRFSTPPSYGLCAVWGCFGGVCALSSPVVGWTWALATSLRWCATARRIPINKKHLLKLFVSAIVSIVAVAPWIAYQSNRLRMFVPIKSNAAFEFFQGQIVLKDGVVESSSFPLHPYYRGLEGDRYREVGEKEYMSEKYKLSREWLANHQLEYIRRCIYRFLAATVWLRSESPEEELQWQFMLMKLFAALPALGAILFMLHFLKFSVGTCQNPFPGKMQNQLVEYMPVVCTVYIVYLLPYVFTSYYERYGIALTFPRILLTIYLINAIRISVASSDTKKVSTTET